MTQEEKRIKLAEAKGQSIDFFCLEHGTVPRNRIKDGNCPWCGLGCADECPDYFNDLNAVHEFIMQQSDQVKWEVFEQLTHIVSAEIPAACASAAEWSEAIGKTLKLW
jgi:hypothetical protein